MGLFRSIPLIERGLPFLQEVNFTDLEKDLAKVHRFHAARSVQKAAAEEVTSSAAIEEIDGLLTKFPNIVGIQPLLEKLRLDLGPASGNSVFVTGPRESGKTTLIEALIRTRAEGRLSSQLGTKPFYIFDATGFFTQTKPGEDRINQFMKALAVVASSNGMLIIDHIDDFVEMAGGSEATLLLNALVSTLEKNRRRGMQAIILAEDTGAKAVYDAGKSLPRAFKSFPLTKEPSFDELKPILMSSAVMLETVHNLNYTEEAVDEMIRLLSRYPGRAFTHARPGNAIQFADMVGAYVRRNQYAEPQKISDMRQRLSSLQDEYAVILCDGEDGRLEKLAKDIAQLTDEYAKAEGDWRKQFEPLFKAQKNFATIERELPILRAMQPRTEEENRRLVELQDKQNLTLDESQEMVALQNKRGRTKVEEEKFNIYTDNYEKAKDAVAAAEQALYSAVPTVRAEHVRAVFNAQAGVSIKSPAETRERLKNLEGYLDTQIFLQDKPKAALAAAYRARERGVKDPSRPIVLLFAGGSGLGKTEAVKAVVRYHLGLENRPDLADQIKPVLISLSEYASESSSSKLLGADPGLVGYGEPIPWHEDIRKDPKSIVLFDEGDKAHPKVFLTLMQVFDEGMMKDSAQKEINFKDTIIIVTINGITDDNIPPEKKGDTDYIFQKVLEVQSESGGQLFTPAVVNRFDGIYIFEKLGEPQLVSILKKELRKVNNDFRDQGVTVVMDDDAANAIIHAYPNPGAGGRGPRKLVQSHIRPKILQYVDQRDEELIAAGAGDVVSKSTLRIGFNGENVTLTVQPADEPQPKPAASPTATPVLSGAHPN